MPVDVDASVLGNTRLSDDYNVLALEAPAIAARVQPGSVAPWTYSERSSR